MGVDKQGSKNGGSYVGGFLQLFDWNGKSRKKLFSNKSDFPEGSKHRKRSEDSSPMTRLHLIDEDDYGRSSIKGSSDYSCASSVTDEDGIGTKAPGVVARLMGLDCLPTSGVAEPYSSPIYECSSLRDGHYRRTPEMFYESQFRHMRNQATELEGFTRKPVETRPQKMFNRPIERFQSETLPPRSVKSIPITHHKLLSPIKNPGFIPTKNAAQIMEEAAKIIERGPQPTNKGKMQPLGSPSVPLKFRDMKEKMEAVHRPSKLPEASQRPTGSNALKHLKGQSLNKSWNGSEDTPQMRNSPYSDDSNYIGSKNKGKSISLAVQAKVNVQRREGLGSTGNKTTIGQKELHEFKSKKPFRSQLTAQKGLQKKPCIDKSSGVLRQNNQKQNGMSNRDKLPCKPSVPIQQDRKPLSTDASSSRNKSSNKVAGTSKAGSRKTAFDADDTEKDVQSSKSQNFPRKKRSLERDFRFEKSPFVDTVSVNRNELHAQSNVAIDTQLKWVDENRRKGMDVVSFTFTSPLKKTMPGSQSPAQLVSKNINFCLEANKDKFPTDAKDTRLSSMGLDVIGGDALSILLEQKIKELTHGVESSFRNSAKSGNVASPAASLQDLVSEFSALSTTAREHRNRSQQSDQCDSNCSSADGHELQGVEEMDDCYSSNKEARKELDCRHPSPVSVLEPSFSNESSNSSDSGDSYYINGGKQCLSSEALQMVNSICLKKSLAMETETELSDSASFTFTGIVSKEHATRSRLSDHTISDEWELDYVREILCNAELMFKDFALGRACDIINPHLFDRLESRRTWSGSFSDDTMDFKLRRKTLFDCVGECLDLRCRRYVGGGSEKWAKGMAMVRSKEWLADEVYKEISGLRNMGNWLLDEVVDKDMSTQTGKWLDFGVEEFEVGVEIEKKIVSSLVDEIVVDMLLFKP